VPNPKGKTPSLLSLSTGKPSIDSANNQKRCSRCKTTILKGQKYFQIPKSEAGFTKQKPFCLACFKKILDKTKKEIEELESDLDLAIKDQS
jgi:hypothetical protein